MATKVPIRVYRPTVTKGNGNYYHITLDQAPIRIGTYDLASVNTMEDWINELIQEGLGPGLYFHSCPDTNWLAVFYLEEVDGKIRNVAIDGDQPLPSRLHVWPPK